MIKFDTRVDLIKYLESGEWKHKQKRYFDIVYFLIEYRKEVHPYVFIPYGNSFVELKCKLLETYCTGKELQKHIDEELGGILAFERDLKQKILSYEDGCLKEIVMEMVPLYLLSNMKLIDVLNDAECFEWLTNREGVSE